MILVKSNGCLKIFELKTLPVQQDSYEFYCFIRIEVAHDAQTKKAEYRIAEALSIDAEHHLQIQT